MLKLAGVHVGYGRTTVVHGASIEVPAGGVAAVMGHNGAGKTTLLRAAVGLLHPSAGSIMLDGEDITRMRPNVRLDPATRVCGTRRSVSGAGLVCCF